jgi:hypothetical protein
MRYETLLVDIADGVAVIWRRTAWSISRRSPASPPPG